MYYTDDSILPENMEPLIITAAPYGPEWLPGDADVPVTWDEQVQAAVDCYNAGATMLHVHVRDPATGQGSTNLEQYNYFLGRLKQAVPKMILQVGGSISFSPHTAEAKAKWLDYDTRHMLAELDPKPEFVTVATGTTQWDVVSMFVPDDIKGTHLDNNPQGRSYGLDGCLGTGVTRSGDGPEHAFRARPGSREAVRAEPPYAFRNLRRRARKASCVLSRTSGMADRAGRRRGLLAHRDRRAT